MRRVYLFAGVSLLVLAACAAGPLLAASGQKNPPPKKSAPALHKAEKPAAKPKHARAPKKHEPPKKAAPKVAHHAKPAAKPVIHHPTGPAHKAHAAEHPVTNKNNWKVTHSKTVNNVASHSISTSRGSHEWHSYHFSQFNKERGAYSFHSHWWKSFASSPGSGGWSGWQSNSGEVPALEVAPVQGGGPVIVRPVVVNVAPPVIKIKQGLPMSRDGRALAATLDGMDVEHHWLPGRRVDWKTGNVVGDDEPGTTNNDGAFVAAVGARFRLPMPEADGTNFLSSNQFEWLLFDGQPKGWVAMGEVEAQLLANQGWVVIAVWKNTASPGERKTPGIVAVVRPDSKPVGEVVSAGPSVILAGEKNRQSIAISKAFPTSARENSEIVFMAHRQRQDN